MKDKISAGWRRAAGRFKTGAGSAIIAGTALLLLASPVSAAFPKHPFVLANEAELAALRQQIARPGWKRDLYRETRGFSTMHTGQGIRPNADLWMSRDIVIPDRGGHFHHFFCTEGDQLEAPQDQQFVPGPYECPKCGKLYDGEKYEGGLRRMAHAWLAQAAWDLAMVAALEHRPEYAAKSAEILLKYADAYPGPHTGITQGGMIFQSLCESMWVIPLAQAYDLIHRDLDEKQREKIEAFLRTVAGGIRVCGVHGNWGSWHLSAVGVVGYAIGDQEMVDWATGKFQSQIRNELGDDGLWPESVHTYHFFPLVAFQYFAEAARHAGVDLYRWEAKPGKSLLAMFREPLGYMYPDLRLPAINDGWFQAFLPADCYELAYARTGDPAFGWVVRQFRRPDSTAAEAAKGRIAGIYGFLFGGETPSNTVPPPARSINFPVLGTCMLRSSGGVMMSFDYGKFFGHGHNDKMGVTLFAHKLWMADYGTPGYGSAILPWYQSAFAHNTVIVDGLNQQRTKENDAFLWLGGDDLEAVQSTTSEAYPGVSFTRTVIRVDDVFVIRDQLRSEAERVYDFYLHSEGKLTLPDPARPGNPGNIPTNWIESIAIHPATATLSGQWKEGGAGVAFWMTGSGPITPLTGLCPAESGSRKIQLLMARQTGKTAEFVTVLAPFKGRAGLRVTRRDGEFRIRHGGESRTLRLPGFGERPQIIRRKSW